MTKEVITQENQVLKARKPETQEPVKQVDGADKAPHGPAEVVASLQRTVGNRAVQRMLVQRSGDSAFELDDDTAGRINQQRGGGQALDANVQRQMGGAMGQDFSNVRVHTSSDAHELNEKVGAVAFTTGSDIFFREGAYNPGSSGGQELLAHELTHVVQQSSGAVPGGDKMSVNAPNDSFEQEADTVAKSALSQPVQRQAEEEEEDVQTQRLQRQEEEEEEVQMKSLQRQEEDEEEVQMKRLQRQEEDEEEVAS